jgi:hypothetical protein
MGKKVNQNAKNMTGNSGHAGNGKFTYTGCSKALNEASKRKDSKGPRSRG